MSVTLLTVGFELPGHGADRRLRSDESILDGDVIVFDPDLSGYFSYSSPGRVPYVEPGVDSQIRRDLSHWREELETALRAGKTVFVFLSAVQEMPPVQDHLEAMTKPFGSTFARTGAPGDQQWNNYAALPVDLGRIVPRGGREIRLAGDARELAAYWREFGPDSVYEAYLDQPIGTPVFVTKTGSKVVGTIIPHGPGHLVLLPRLEYDLERFWEQVREGDDEDCYDWTREGQAYGARLTKALLEVDRALRREAGIIPPPAWADDSAYRTPREAVLLGNLESVEASLAKLREEAAALERELSNEGSLRQLLFGTGAMLEAAILDALRAMGFTAERLAANGSEFDAVFSAAEGRFLGEAEGRDTKPISVDKLDQLERNIREDFSQRDDGTYAKGVLFGNAYRLARPDSRGDYFTEKCMAAARRSGVALVRTPDLFPVACYLRARSDLEYATACRRALLDTSGDVVRWPEVPDVPPAAEVSAPRRRRQRTVPPPLRD